MLECKRCLLREQQGDLARAVRLAVERIPSGERTKDVLYEERLQKCRSCEKLLSGMCRVCGCYVEVRAAYHWQECPGEGKYW